MNQAQLLRYKAEVLSKVSIPMYFYNVIVPQLGDYYANYPVDFDNKPVVCCPLHDEDTPSCRYYPETESFYCFGCQKGGSVLNLHRYFAERLNGNTVSNEQAIMFLYDYFIKNNETIGVIDKTSQVIDKPVRKSNDIEIVRYNHYVETLNNSLMVDNHIDFKIKELIWSELDNIRVLLNKNEIGAVDALKHIKLKVKETIR